MQAEASAATLKDWNAVYSSFKKFSHCDDGAIAEGYSESISQLLANHWEQTASLEKLISADKKFRDFVIKHVDETVPAEMRSKILENAQKQCSKKSKQFCSKIIAAAK